MLVSRKQLLRGKPVKVKGIGTLVPPTLGSIFELSDNEENIDKYNLFINILLIELPQFLEIAKLKSFYSQLPDEVQCQCSLFNLLLLKPDIRQTLFECLSFFIAEKIEYCDKEYCFKVIDNKGQTIGVINNDNFESVRNNLLRLNCVNKKHEEKLKFKDEKARQVYLRCQKGREEFQKAKPQNDKKYNLINLVEYVATKSHSYNFFNIWDLTIYQFNVEFQRINFYNQVDTYTKRWSTWGEDKFDFSVWYENIEILNNGGKAE